MLFGLVVLAVLVVVQALLLAIKDVRLRELQTEVDALELQLQLAEDAAEWDEITSSYRGIEW